MTQPSRRRFLALTGASAAALSAAAVVPNAMAAGAEAAVPLSADELDAVSGPLVAYVEDPGTGEVTVMVGEHEVTVVDHDLAAKIVRLGRTEA